MVPSLPLASRATSVRPSLSKSAAARNAQPCGSPAGGVRWKPGVSASEPSGLSQEDVAAGGHQVFASVAVDVGQMRCRGSCGRGLGLTHLERAVVALAGDVVAGDEARADDQILPPVAVEIAGGHLRSARHRERRGLELQPLRAAIAGQHGLALAGHEEVGRLAVAQSEQAEFPPAAQLGQVDHGVGRRRRTCRPG